MPDRVPMIAASLGSAPPDPLFGLCRVVATRVRVVDAGDVPSDTPLIMRFGTDLPWRAGGPQVTWVEAPGQLAACRPGLVVTSSSEVVAKAEELGRAFRMVPERDVEPDSAPVAPFVRERLRRARGVGEGILVETADGALLWDGRQVDVWLSSALSLAAVTVAATANVAVRALAWGCPVIAPSAIREQLGVTGEFLAEAGDDPITQARALAADSRRCARLSRLGRLRYEKAHSLTCAADDVLRSLGVCSLWAPSNMQLRLEELDSRRDENPRLRFAELVAGITDEENR